MKGLNEYFFKSKVKALPSESTDIQKIVCLATRERDSKKVLEILTNHSQFMKSSDIIQIISHLPMKIELKLLEYQISILRHMIWLNCQ